MARVPLLERAFGQDRLARIHRLVGFTSFNLMLAHIVADHLGLRRRRPRPRPRRRCGTSSSTTRACCSPSAGTVVPGHGRGHQRQGRPPAAALRVLAPAAPLRLPRRRARAAAPAVDRPGVPRPPPARDRVLVDASGPSPPAAVLVWRVGLPLWRNLRHRLRVTSVVPRGRRRRCRSTSPAAASTGCRVEAGQFLTWRFLGRPGWTRANPYSLSAAPDGRSLRITVRALGDGSAAAAPPAARHPRARRGSVRPAQRPGPHPAQGRADRRRRRHHPAAGAGRGARLRARARRVLLHRYTDEPLFARELDALAARARAPGARAARPPSRARTPGSATASAPRRRPHRPAPLGPRHRRARRLRLRPRRRGPTCVRAHLLGRRRSRPSTSTSRPSVVT